MSKQHLKEVLVVVFILVLVLVSGMLWGQTEGPLLVPKPSSLELRSGNVRLGSTSVIRIEGPSVDSDRARWLRSHASVLAAEMEIRRRRSPSLFPP